MNAVMKRPRFQEHPPVSSSFGSRLFMAMTVVVIGCVSSAWIVASVMAPGIFHDHLGQAGIDPDSSEAAHVEEAFTWAIVLAWGLAVAIAVLLALAVSWYVTHRVQRSLTAVTASTGRIAGGRYDTRVQSPGLGREFDELAQSFNELARRLASTETTRRRILADLGHEIRTPVATLDSYLEALEDGVRVFDEETIQILRSSTHRLERLAQDIAAVSRAEEHLTQLRPIAIAVDTLALRATQSVAEQFENKGVTLQTDLRFRSAVLADPERLAQVLGNLLDNALRHTPIGGVVTVASRQSNFSHAEIVVADTGEGISNEHLDHLFDRFYRADSARDRRHGGSGIGLTITRALVEAHHGSIQVHSDGIGHGARFTIKLPIGH